MSGFRTAGHLARAFINSKLTPLAVAGALLLGVVATLDIPREEEPQIVVPVLDVFARMPGATAEEVEQRVTVPMEKLLRELPDVEYIYSISQPGMSLVIIRFYVGVDEADAIVRTYNKLYSNFDRIPPGVSEPLVKVRSIDDVPILALTLWGPGYDAYHLRQLAGELEYTLKQVENVSETSLIGGLPRRLRVELDGERLAAYGLNPPAVVAQLSAANRRAGIGSYSDRNREVAVDAGRFLKSAAEFEQVVVGLHNQRPVYLRDVARVVDGPAEPDSYVLFGDGGDESTGDYPAVTLTLAKRKGTNATALAGEVLEKVESLRDNFLPPDLNVTVTRNYGETAREKSDELLKHLLIATLSVALLIGLTLGWRESGVVLIAIPVTLALTLAIFYFYGYTLNRVTLFALIFSIGILVDDAIVIVENIVRHFRLPENRGRPLPEVAVEAVDEVGNPTILATFTVIAAILPMAFVRGLMGPYMMPIPVGASAAMLFSLVVAFVVSPWAALRLLKQHASQAGPGGHGDDEVESWTTKLYRRVMGSLIADAKKRWLFLGGVGALLVLVVLLLPFRAVEVKMLPFDNKSEFQVIVDMPEGTTLEETTRVAQALGRHLAAQPEVVNYQVYSGTSGPYNFNGLVRHYFLRRGANVADIQVNLLPRHERSAKSHDIAKRVRPELQRIAGGFGANIKIAEVPPGPPVLQTVVAEIYGPDLERQQEVALQIRAIFEQTPGVVDVDWYVEDPQTRYDIVVDLGKAALHGVSAALVTRTLEIALAGETAGLLHAGEVREDVLVEVRLARSNRSSLEELLNLRVQGASGQWVSVREVTTVRETTVDTSIYRKNLRRVVYVTGDVAGEAESPVYPILQMRSKIAALEIPEGYRIDQYTSKLPGRTDRLAMKWDGEWHITYEVFRDLGLSFAAVLVLIYVLVVGWFRCFRTPWVIMAPIPLSLIGILPAHAMMGAFFTATSMIGFIAGAGIVVRNSIILVDFVNLRRRQGTPLKQAVIDAGAIRFRPMLLTAAAVVVGASVILFDPIFQGLAISLIAGEVASTFISRMTVPLLYYTSECAKQR